MRNLMAPLYRYTILLLVVALLTPSVGCALMVSRGKQTVTITTTPSGRTVYIDGAPVKDGQSITIKKKFEAKEANVGTANRPNLVELKHNPDIWLLGDAGLLLLGIIPGIIGFGIDFTSGGWREYQNPQILVVPDSPAPVVEPTPKPVEPAPAPVKKPAAKPPTKSPPKPAPSKPAETPVPEPSPIQP